MKSWILHNLGLKLASVFLAVLIWLVVHIKLTENPSSSVKAVKNTPTLIGP